MAKAKDFSKISNNAVTKFLSNTDDTDNTHNTHNGELMPGQVHIQEIDTQEVQNTDNASNAQCTNETDNTDDQNNTDDTNNTNNTNNTDDTNNTNNTNDTNNTNNTNNTHEAYIADNTSKEIKSKRLNLLIQPSLLNDTKKIAHMNHISVNELILRVLKDYAEQEEQQVKIKKYDETF